MLHPVLHFGSVYLAAMGEMGNVYKLFVRWLEGRRPLREIWQEGVDWMHLAQDRDQR
jgi:hypothetical protein